MRLVFDRESSDVLRMVSFLLTILVVVLHSYANSSFLQVLITGAVTRCAVPSFFILSGLFLFKDYEPTNSWAVSKIMTRIRTLLMPYVFWSVAYSMPHLLELSKGSVRFCVEVLGIIGVGPYYAGHMWYIKMLFLFCFVALPIGLFVRMKSTWIIILMFIVILYCFSDKSLYWGGYLWIMLGGVWASNYKKVIELFKSKRTFFVAVFVFISSCVLCAFDLRSSGGGGRLVRVSEMFIILTTMPIAYFVIDRFVSTSFFEFGKPLLPSAFFIYCFHPIVYQMIRPGEYMVWYLRVLLNITICVVLYFLLQRCARRLLEVATGGR